MTVRTYIHPHDPDIEVVDILDEGVLVKTYNRWSGLRKPNSTNYNFNDFKLTLDRPTYPFGAT